MGKLPIISFFGKFGDPSTKPTRLVSPPSRDVLFNKVFQSQCFDAAPRSDNMSPIWSLSTQL